MLRIWEEFFKLKWEEIREWIKDNKSFKYSVGMIWTFSYYLFIIIPCTLISGGSYISKFNAIMLLGLPITYYAIIIFIAVIKWLRSSWKQAKKNVSRKSMTLQKGDNNEK